MASINKITIQGRLTADPKVNVYGGKTKVVFNLANNRKYKNKDKVVVEEVCFVDIEAWNTLADVVVKYFKKGSVAIIEGRLKFNKWTDSKTNETKTKHTIECDNIILQEDAPSEQQINSIMSQTQAQVPQASQQQVSQPKPMPYGQPQYQQPGYQPKQQESQPANAIDDEFLPF